MIKGRIEVTNSNGDKMEIFAYDKEYYASIGWTVKGEDKTKTNVKNKE
jgi:hypothetical protein|tara:strand:+ start:151 stop:294 length:144 start_codon:yes stop_codon:yes gene_type:complete